ncbi:MAG: SgcJ/EcaC family oxidoreductase [Natronospirillum sp.]|uniref:SgcJ/EcaC family oxidoreductase n=1 Tax=Natronospirillum sp. TaxID=2812955 RepID=UPI0025F0D94F|nr:SgcJ/EcaC family oxidoreductase [Natronospirillum sp.]MCH8551091.1 SgcJ/EcaC family oxidoreductase [Natronospirillum sp.]
MSTNHEEIRALFDDWNRALATLDPDNVVALYAPDAVLLPTVSNRVRTDHEGIRDYFSEFLGLQPQGTVQESHVRLHGDIALHSGVYLFHMGATGADVRARFTFAYRHDGTRWQIIEHHSSTMPEGQD